MPAAAAALEAWAKVAKLKPGAPIFTAVHNRTIAATRIGAQHVSLVLKRRVRALALASGRMPEEAVELAIATSGHSLRAGCITSMVLAGVPEHEIRRRSRHASAEMVARYVRVAQQWQDSGLKAVGFRLDDHQVDRDTLSWLAQRLGSKPLVPDHVRQRGDTSEIIAAALSALPARRHHHPRCYREAEAGPSTAARASRRRLQSVVAAVPTRSARP